MGVRLIIQSRLVFFCCIPYFENRLCFHFSFLTKHSSFFISHLFLRLLVALPLLRHPVFVIYTKWEGDILLIPLSLHFPYSSYNFQTQTSNPSNFKPFKPFKLQTPNPKPLSSFLTHFCVYYSHSHF